MKTGTRVLAIVVLAALGGAGAWYYQHSQSPDAAKAAAAKPGGPGSAPGAAGPGGGRPVPVLAATVEQRDVPQRLELIGRTEAYSSVTMRARIDGQIIGVHYEAGQPIKAGQKMITLDSRALLATVQQNEANLMRDRAQLVKAESDLQRYSDLVAKGFVSSAQLDIYKAAVDSLAATVRADQAALDLAKVNLGYTTINAPMAGVAGAVLVFPGGSVKANDTALVVINQLKPVYVSFAVPEARLAEIRQLASKGTLKVEARVPGVMRVTPPPVPGRPASQQPTGGADAAAAGEGAARAVPVADKPAEGGAVAAAAAAAGAGAGQNAASAAGAAPAAAQPAAQPAAPSAGSAPGRPGGRPAEPALTGELAFIDNAVDATTGTILMKARFDNADGRLTPGQFVEVSMVLRELKDALVMPAEAQQTGPDGTFVYVAKPEGTVEVRRVQTMPAAPRQLVVLSGLAAGETVVTDGQLRLAPGAKYEIRIPGQRRGGAGGGQGGAGQPGGGQAGTGPAGAGAPGAAPAGAAPGLAAAAGTATQERK